MKVLLLLAAISAVISVTTARRGWSAGKQYVYRYNGTVVTGIPELGHDGSGFGIQSLVVIETPSDSLLRIQLEDVELFSALGKLNIEVKYQQPTTHVRESLGKSFQVKLRDGMVEKIQTCKDDPDWSVNIKSGLLSLLQVNLGQSDLIEPKLKHEELYRVWEDSIGGDCETEYTVSDTAANLQNVTDSGLGLHQAFIVRKVRNYDNCRKDAHTAPVGLGCRPGASQCANIVTRSAVTEYILRGDRHNFLIEHITHRGDVITNALLAATRHTTASTHQTLSLLHYHGLENRVPHLTTPVDRTELRYVMRETAKLGDPPLHLASNLEKESRERQEMVAEIKETIPSVLQEVTSSVHHDSGLSTRHVAQKLMEVTDMVKYLHVGEISEIYANIKSSNIDRQLYIDAIIAAGTNPALKFLLRLMKHGELTGEQAQYFISAIPLVIKTPSKHIIDEMFSVIANGHFQHDGVINDTAILTTSTLIRKLCPDRHGEEEDGEAFCHSRSNVVKKFIRYLRERLEFSVDDDERVLCVEALGKTGHKEAVNILRPYIWDERRCYNKSSSLSEGCSTYLRVAAVLSLADLVVEYPSEIREVLLPVLHNRTQQHSVRCASVVVVMKTEPPTAVLQELATSSWKEPSSHVASQIYSSIASLANSTEPRLRRVAARAAQVLPLAKPVAPSLSKSQISLMNIDFNDINSSLALNVFTIGNSKSIIPETLMAEISATFPGIFTKLAQFHIQSQEIQNIYKKFMGTSSISNEELQEIKKKMDWKSGNSNPTKLHVGFQILNSLSAHIPLTEIVNEKILNSKERIASIFETGKSIEYQRYLPLVDFEIGLPTEVGLFAVVSLRAPTFVSLNGNVSVEASSQGASGVVNISTDLRPLLASQLVGKLTIMSPMIGEKAESGLKKDLIADLPVSSNVLIHPGSSKVHYRLVPATRRRREIFYLRTRPFTQKFELGRRESLSEERRVVTQQHKLKLKRTVYGAAVGVRVEVEQKTQDEMKDLHSVFQTPVTSRDYRVKVTFDPHRSEVKGVKGQLIYGSSRMNCEKDQLLQHPTRLDKYLQCVDDVTMVRDCPSGEKFISDEGRCRKVIMKHVIREGPTDRMLKKLDDSYVGSLCSESGPGLHPSPHSCRSYINCVVDSDSGTVETCPLGMWWNPDSGTCDTPGSYCTPSVKTEHQTDCDSFCSRPVQDVILICSGVNAPECCFYCQPSGEERSSTDKPGDSTRISNLMLSDMKNTEDTSQVVVDSPKVSEVHGVAVSLETIGASPRSFYKSVDLVEGTMRGRPHRKLSVRLDTTDYQMHVDADMSFPKKLDEMEREELMDNDITTDGEIRVSVGEKKLQENIKIKIRLMRDAEMVEYSRLSEAARRCERDEDDHDFRSSPECRKTKQLASSLNKLMIDIHFDKLPRSVLYLTTKLDDLLKSKLYSFMDNNRLNISNPPNQLKIQLRVRPDGRYMDATVQKPAEETNFSSVEAPPLLQSLLPPSLVVGPSERLGILDTLYPVCILEGHNVVTFDLLRYREELGDCWYLLVGSRGGGVFVKREGQHQKMKIYLGPNKVELPADLTSLLVTASDGVERRVDLTEGHRVRLLEEGNTTVTVKKLSSTTVAVWSGRYGLSVVKTDDTVHIRATPDLRGATRGLCGNNNGDFSDDMLAPENCRAENLLTFVRSYIVPSSYCKRGQSKCTDMPCEGSSCPKLRTMVLETDGKVCFSKRPLPACVDDQEPGQLKKAMVEFHCLSPTRSSNRLAAKAQLQILHNLRHKSTDYVMLVPIPSICE